jgi:tetratricopeptide (TPR) repeat protein
MTRLIALALLLAFSWPYLEIPAYSQGMGLGETGFLYGMTKFKGPKGSVETTQQRYSGSNLTNPEFQTKSPDIPTQSPAGVDLDAETIAKISAKNANNYFSLAQKKEKAGNLDEAQKLYFKALSIRERVWGDKDPAVASITFKIAEIHLKKGNKDAADVCFKRYLSIQAKNYGPGAYELVPVLIQLGNIALSQKRYMDAYSYFNRVVPLQERKLGDDAAETIDARLNLVDALVGLKEWKEAQKYLKTSETIAVNKGDDHNKNYLRICDDYVAVLMGLNCPEEAEKYAVKAQTLRSAALPPAAQEPLKKTEKESKVIQAEKTISAPTPGNSPNIATPVTDGGTVPAMANSKETSESVGAPQPGSGEIRN